MSRSMLKKPMPLSPRLSIYRWRAPMIASIVHRATGGMLVLFSLFLLCLLVAVNAPPERFFALQQWMQSPVGYTFLLLAGASLIYHACNGLRFILLDFGLGESREQMRLSANISLGIGVVALLLMAVWL